MLTWLVACALKAAVLLAASWLGAALLRRGPAAARHQIWALGVVGALAIPLLSWAAPGAPLALSSDALASIAATGVIDGPAVVVTPGAPHAAASTWPTWIMLAWAVGAALMALRVLRGHLAARRLVRTATSVGDEAGVPLLRSETIGSPMTIGVVRPRVVLPAAADAWSAERRRAVLVHELGHVRRRDTLVQLAAQLACALYWWNPLAWLAAARLRAEREHACDDLVLAAGVRPSSYAEALLDVARATSAPAHAGAIGMVDRADTEARLRRILDASVARRAPRARFRIATSALALAGAVTLACTSSSAPVGPDASAKLGALSVGDPFVRQPPLLAPPSLGEVDLARVAAEVQRRLGALEQCYERRLATKPGLAGTVVIHWIIDETGNVPEQCITEDTVQDAEISGCVNELVGAGRFPASTGGTVDVSFPFVFAPARS